MSGVYIPGMEMPTSCAECFVKFCKGRAQNKRLMVQRGANCPLVPVPPHGALMDRDDFLAECPELVDGYKHITDDFVVVEAEGGDAQ